jgi:hypothetical protein
MANWPLTPAVDHITLVVFQREAHAAVGQAFDAGYEDVVRAREALHHGIALLQDQLIRVERHAEAEHERGLEERETSVPPYSA